jgi:hypothetical protein
MMEPSLFLFLALSAQAHAVGGAPAPEAVTTETESAEFRQRRRIHSAVHAQYHFASLQPGERRDRIVDPIVDIDAVPTPDAMLQRLTCSASAVVVGRVMQATGVVSEGRDLVYTDYEILVHEVLATGGEATVKSRQILLVTRPGGTASWNGQTTSVRLNEYPELAVGERYLLFLERRLASGAYTTVGADGALRLSARRVEPLGPWIVKGPPPDDALARVLQHEPCAQDR